MLKNNIKYALLLLSVILIGIRFSDIYSVFGIKPDIVLILLIRKAMHEPKPHISVLWAFFAGMATDILIGDVIGISSLAYSVACFAVSAHKRRSVYLAPYKRSLVYLSAVLFCSVLIYSVTLSGMPFLKNMFHIALPSALYTLIIAAALQTLKPTK
ncbi:MAG: rod shape-determining protein MreD [Candidatus Delongbacteria bacterium]|nr:rod shape-determining protein MreD [Candidatus Delongbacteria bacterium]